MEPHDLPTGILRDQNIIDSFQWDKPLITGPKGERLNINEIDSLCLIQACSYDLRIGTIFKEKKILRGDHMDELVAILAPGDIISLFTFEELNLPSNITATVFPPNFLSSEGLLVLNPGHVDPGFCGPLSARLVNMSSAHQTISIRDRIFTAIFEVLPQSVNKSYSSRSERSEVERRFHKMDVRQNPQSLGKMLSRGSHPPFVSPEEVRKIVTQHWLSWLTFVLTVAAAIAAVIAAIQGFRNQPMPYQIQKTFQNTNEANQTVGN